MENKTLELNLKELVVLKNCVIEDIHDLSILIKKANKDDKKELESEIEVLFSINSKLELLIRGN